MTDHVPLEEMNRRREDKRITALLDYLERKQKQIVRLLSIALLGLISVAGLILQLFQIVQEFFKR